MIDRYRGFGSNSAWVEKPRMAAPPIVDMSSSDHTGEHRSAPPPSVVRFEIALQSPEPDTARADSSVRSSSTARCYIAVTVGRGRR